MQSARKLWYALLRKDKAYKELEQKYLCLLEASEGVVQFCYPNGLWRGYANMKGLMGPVHCLSETCKYGRCWLFAHPAPNKGPSGPKLNNHK